MKTCMHRSLLLGISYLAVALALLCLITPHRDGARAEEPGRPGKADAGTSKDQATRVIAMRVLNKMWAGSLIYYESQHTEENQAKHSKFPGKQSSSMTPDCCKAKGKCPPESLWKKEPWASLNFVPDDETTGMRFDYLSAGEGDHARFVAVVAIDRACTGKPIYLSRQGAINENGDVDGKYQPVEGSSPPPLAASK